MAARRVGRAHSIISVIRGGGEVGAAERRMRVDGIGGSGNVEPVVAILERGEEIFEPAVLVAMRVGAGPTAEFFEIVSHGGDSAGMRAGLLPEEMGGFGDVAKRDEVAKRLESREKLDGMAQIFGDVVAVELFGLESGGEEMIVVDERVFDAAAASEEGSCGSQTRSVSQAPRGRSPKCFST